MPDTQMLILGACSEIIKQPGGKLSHRNRGRLPMSDAKTLGRELAGSTSPYPLLTPPEVAAAEPLDGWGRPAAGGCEMLMKGRHPLPRMNTCCAVTLAFLATSRTCQHSWFRIHSLPSYE